MGRYRVHENSGGNVPETKAGSLQGWGWGRGRRGRRHAAPLRLTCCPGQSIKSTVLGEQPRVAGREGTHPTGCRQSCVNTAPRLDADSRWARVPKGLRAPLLSARMSASHGKEEAQPGVWCGVHVRCVTSAGHTTNTVCEHTPAFPSSAR